MIARVCHDEDEPDGGNQVEPAAASSSASQLDEARLIDAAVAGDRLAFATLYDQYIDRVYRHCYYRVANRTDAEDLAQQTFLQAWQAIGRYRRGETPFVAWLLTISQRLAISHFRQQRPMIDLTAIDLTPAPDSDPADDVTSSVLRDAVRAAILQLKPDRQAVIILRFIEGFTVAEVAAALGKNENHVHVIQHRALAELRGRLALPASESAAHEPTLARRFRAAIDGLRRARTDV